MDSQPKNDGKPQSTLQVQLSSKPRRKARRSKKSTLGHNNSDTVTGKKDSDIHGSTSVSGNEGGFDGDVEDGAESAMSLRHTPPPSFLSASQQELLKVSKKGPQFTSGRSGGGSRLNVVISADESPTSSITAPSTTEPNGPTGPLPRSAQDAFDASDSSQVAQQVTSCEQSVDTAQPNRSPRTSQQRKRKASAPLEDPDGGVRKPKRATTRRIADNGSMTAPSCSSTSSDTRRSLREKKKIVPILN